MTVAECKSSSAAAIPSIRAKHTRSSAPSHRWSSAPHEPPQKLPVVHRGGNGQKEMKGEYHGI